MDLQKLEQIKALRAKYRGEKGIVDTFDRASRATDAGVHAAAQHLTRTMKNPGLMDDPVRHIREIVGAGDKASSKVWNKPASKPKNSTADVHTPSIPSIKIPKNPRTYDLSPEAMDRAQGRLRHLAFDREVNPRESFVGPKHKPRGIIRAHINSREGETPTDRLHRAVGKMDEMNNAGALSAKLRRHGDPSDDFRKEQRKREGAIQARSQRVRRADQGKPVPSMRDIMGGGPSPSGEPPSGPVPSNSPLSALHSEEELKLGETPRSMPINRTGGIQEHETNPYVLSQESNTRNFSPSRTNVSKGDRRDNFGSSPLNQSSLSSRTNVSKGDRRDNFGLPSSTRTTPPAPIQKGQEESGSVVENKKPRKSKRQRDKEYAEEAQSQMSSSGERVPLDTGGNARYVAERKNPTARPPRPPGYDVTNYPGEETSLANEELTSQQKREKLAEQTRKLRAKYDAGRQGTSVAYKVPGKHPAYLPSEKEISKLGKKSRKKSFGEQEEKAMDIDTKAAKKTPLPKELQGLPRSAATTRGVKEDKERGIARQESRPLTRAEQKLVRGPQKATGSSKRELPRGTVNFGPLARTVNETPEQIATINRANAEIEARERAGKPRKIGKREGQQLAQNAPRGTSTTVGGRLKEGMRYDKEGQIKPQKYYGTEVRTAGQAPKRGSKPHDIPDVPFGSGHGEVDLGVGYARGNVTKKEQEERPFSKPLKEASYGRVSHRAHPHLSGSVASTPLAHPTGTIDVSEKRPAKASMRVVSGMSDEPRTSQHGRDTESGEDFVFRGSPHYPQATPVRRDNRLANAARKVGGAIARGAGAVASRLGLVGSMKLGRERKAPELVQGPQQPKQSKPQGMTISRNYGRALNELGVRNQGESEQEKASRAAMQSTARKIAEAGMQQHRQTRMANTSLPGYQTGYQPSQSFTHSKAGKSTSEGYNAARERMRERTGKSMTIQNKADSFADRIGLVKAARPVVGPKMPPHIAKRRAAEAAGGYVVGGATAQEPVSRGLGRARYQRKIAGVRDENIPSTSAYYGAPREQVSSGRSETINRGGQETGPGRAQEHIAGRAQEYIGGRVDESNIGGRIPPVMRHSARQQERLMINPKGRRIFPQESKHLSDDQTRAEKFMGRLARKNQNKNNTLGSLGAAGGLESMAALI